MKLLDRIVGRARGTEGIQIDPDYAHRKGYDADFLGQAVPLPGLSDQLAASAAVNTEAVGEPRYLLPYYNFTVVMNKNRRLAFFTAVNIDGTLSQQPKRANDHWFFDPRISAGEQAGKEIYDKNDLDLGHLVRRLDPAWGQTPDLAKLANDDTFHFTNCSPQHKDFNRNKTRWAGMEDYILKNADNLNFRVNVFTGPVFAADDDQYRGVQLPRQFWKVVTMAKSDGQLSATAYLLSQEDLIQGIRTRGEPFSYGAYRTYQVTVRKLEELTGLSFGSLVAADPFARQRGVTAAARELDEFDDAVL